MEILFTHACAPFFAALINVLALPVLGMICAACACLSSTAEANLLRTSFVENSLTKRLRIHNAPILLTLLLALAGFGLSGCVLQIVTNAETPLPVAFLVAVASSLLMLQLVGPVLARRLHGVVHPASKSSLHK